MRTRFGSAIQLVVSLVLFTACADSAGNLVSSAGARFLFDEDWMIGNCFGGTCQQIAPSGAQATLFSQITNEMNRLRNMTGNPTCTNLGDAMFGMLDRRAYFVRIEGFYSTGPTSGLAGRYDPSDGPQSIPSPGATNNAANGAI